MHFNDIPIRKKLLRIIFLINGILLLVTCVTFFIYELYIFRRTTVEKISSIGKIIAVNSTAALAFENADDAKEILSALKAEKHIVAACLYDKNGKIFAQYPVTSKPGSFPAKPDSAGYFFTKTKLELFEPVVQDTKLQGVLYLKSDLGTMYERFRLYGIVAGLVITISFLLAYLLSRILQRAISIPILSLAKVAKAVSDKKDYSVRAKKTGNDELGLLTDSFNQMLAQIEEQNLSLKEFNSSLEEKVKDRTRQLENVNKELEAFSYSISHDLRAPLRSIIGFTSILAEDYEGKLDDEAKRLMSRVIKNTLKMGTLIDDLLSFSRVGRMDLEKNNMNTNRLVKDVITELDPLNKNIRWDIGFLPDSNGDIRVMRQVWINLLSNAIKYSRNVANPHIEIGAVKEDGQITFFVRDNGVGFDEHYKDKLFKVFQRLHSASEFEGTGVGLAIVEKIISRHDGRVWAESEKNKGATFYFSLPV